MHPFGDPEGSTIAVAAGDLDADGDPDLVLSKRDAPANQILLNDGSLHFGEAMEFGTVSDETRSVALADLDGDGALDIVAVNIGQPNAVYLGLGGGRFQEGIPFGADEHTYTAVVADMDGDGDVDIVVGNVGSPNAVYFNDGSGRVWSEQKVGDEAESTCGVATADLDGDGYLDIGFANSEAVNRIFFNVNGRWDPGMTPGLPAPGPPRLCTVG